MQISLGMVFTYSLSEINSAVSEILKLINIKNVIAFHGNLGAGKTTLISAVCRELGVAEKISSPTFSIINEYTSPNIGNILHIDLYRLKNETDAINAGVEDCLASGSLCFVEWPEKAPKLFEDSVHCYLTTLNENMRKMLIKL